jgi:hypothetical protein
MTQRQEDCLEEAYLNFVGSDDCPDTTDQGEIDAAFWDYIDEQRERAVEDVWSYLED